MKFKTLFICLLFIILNSFLIAEGTLFVGIESAGVNTYYSDMSGFPNVN